MSSQNGIDFLFGKVVKVQTGNGTLSVLTRNDSITIPQQKGVEKIVPGRFRMIVVRDGKILGIYGRARIRLLHTIYRGGHVTEEVIECSFPMYPKRDNRNK